MIKIHLKRPIYLRKSNKTERKGPGAQIPSGENKNGDSSMEAHQNLKFENATNTVTLEAVFE